MDSKEDGEEEREDAAHSNNSNNDLARAALLQWPVAAAAAGNTFLGTFGTNQNTESHLLPRSSTTSPMTTNPQQRQLAEAAVAAAVAAASSSQSDNTAAATEASIILQLAHQQQQQQQQQQVQQLAPLYQLNNPHMATIPTSFPSSAAAHTLLGTANTAPTWASRPQRLILQQAAAAAASFPTTTTSNSATSSVQPQQLLQYPSPVSFYSDTKSDDQSTRDKADTDELQRLQAKARQHVEDAIQNSVPFEEKKAYLQAKQVAAQLVAQETDAMQFVRYCQYNTWQAAKRLCEYWKERLDIFGPDRAFLPLTLTGSGALRDNDLLTLQAGYPCILPPSSTGRLVVLADRRQWIASTTTENKLRAFFYICKHLAKDDRAQAEDTGGVLLIGVPASRRNFDSQLHHSFSQRCWGLITTAMPVRMQMHLICFVPKQQQQQPQGATLSSYKAIFMQEAVSKHLVGILDHNLPFDCHVALDEDGMKQQLMSKLNLTEVGLPNFLGGKWTFVDAMHWCRTQAKKERDEEMAYFLAAATPTSQSLKSNADKEGLAKEPATATAAAAAAAAAAVVAATPAAALKGGDNDDEEDDGDQKPAARPTQTNHDEEHAATLKRRATNAIHSRRKRERRRNELQMLNQEHQQLGEEKAALEAEHARLTGLLRHAQQEVLSAERRSTSDR